MRSQLALVPLMVIALILVGVLDGCYFRDLKNDLAEIEDSFVLVGKVSGPHEGPGKVVVILFSEADGKQTPVQYVFPEATGHFSFLVKKGVYRVKAFEDLNENFDHDPGEYAGAFGAPIRAFPSKPGTGEKAQKALSNLDFYLVPATTFVDGLESMANLEIGRMPVFKLGALARLDDAVFDQANGSMGYWKPLTFIKQFGIGIYFLEPYDPHRIPVLFVHGATGTPAAWHDMVSALDTDRYQAWFYYYPSGIRLDAASRILSGLIQALHDKHGFDRLYLTAHSMGGLVCRAAILANRHHSDRPYIQRFVSLSTPWGGIRLAKKGVEKAPTAIPSWHDVSPGSQFIQAIYGHPLPPDVSFHLFFSHRGNCSLFMENNDGTVELKSELDYRAQAEADSIYGFDEDHGSILASREMLDRYRMVLGAAQ